MASEFNVRLYFSTLPSINTSTRPHTLVYMSLGFNPLQPRRVTSTLPGGAGSHARPRVPRFHRQVFASRATLERAKAKHVVVPAPRAAKDETPRTTKAETPRTAKGEATRNTADNEEEGHWVYATTKAILLADEGGAEGECAAENNRVVLVYPMRSDPESGRIAMRHKTVHEHTGQFKYTWVVVYDPDASVPHRVSFSMT